MSVLVIGSHGRAVRMMIKVTSPPVDDGANRAVFEAVSEALRVLKRNVTIGSGDRSRLKSVAVSGITIDELRQRLSAILGHSV